jgi:hypothetical protein
MSHRRINIRQTLQEKNTRDETDRILRIREIRKLGSQSKFQDFFFDFETIHDIDNEDPVYDALAWHVDAMWHEACWCYVWGMYRGCIVLAVGSVEAGLKYRLREAGQINDEERVTFGTCIRKGKDCGLLPLQQTNSVIISAMVLDTIRNDIIHANNARRNPGAALSSDSAEHEVIDMGHGLKLIHEFRLGAIDSLKNSRKVLLYLRHHKMRV